MYLPRNYASIKNLSVTLATFLSSYRNNFGSNNYKPYPPNNGNAYGNSYGNSFNPKKNVSSNLENVLKEFIT